MSKFHKVFASALVIETDLSDIFGRIKTGKSGQEFKDEARKGWTEKRFS